MGGKQGLDLERAKVDKQVVETNNFKLWTDNPPAQLNHATRICLRQGTCMHILVGGWRCGWNVRQANGDNRLEPSTGELSPPTTIP